MRRHTMRLTKDEIEAGRSLKGGYTKKQLAKWGVPWPAPKGWKKKLLAGHPIQERRKGGKWKRRGQSVQKPTRNWMDEAYAVTISGEITIRPAKTPPVRPSGPSGRDVVRKVY